MNDRFRNVALTSRGMSMTGQERQALSHLLEPTDNAVHRLLKLMVDTRAA